MTSNPFERNALLASLLNPFQAQTGQSALSGLLGFGSASPSPLSSALMNVPMTPDQYLRQVLEREVVDTGIFSPARQAQTALQYAINTWSNGFLMSVSPSGSFAKGTANRSGTDIDLFISLHPDTPNTLGEVFNTLDQKLKDVGYMTRRQNVSIGVTVDGQKVDLVPAKRQNLLTTDHSLYRSKAATWTKTNIDTHIAFVRQSMRLEEIRVLKLWRNQKGLNFPSFYLELIVIEALGQTLLTSEPYGDLANNVWKVFQYLRDSFPGRRVLDPANTNNVISDDLTAGEKATIRAAAVTALTAQNWNQIVI